MPSSKSSPDSSARTRRMSFTFCSTSSNWILGRRTSAALRSRRRDCRRPTSPFEGPRPTTTRMFESAAFHRSAGTAPESNDSDRSLAAAAVGRVLGVDLDDVLQLDDRIAIALRRQQLAEIDVGASISSPLRRGCLPTSVRGGQRERVRDVRERPLAVQEAEGIGEIGSGALHLRLARLEVRRVEEQLLRAGRLQHAVTRARRGLLDVLRGRDAEVGRAVRPIRGTLARLRESATRRRCRSAARPSTRSRRAAGSATPRAAATKTGCPESPLAALTSTRTMRIRWPDLPMSTMQSTGPPSDPC